MKFLSNFFSFGSNLKRLEHQAKEILELPKDFKAYRFEDDVVIVNSSENKIIARTKDTFSTNPARAALELIKKFNLASNEPTTQHEKKNDVWTCGFRSITSNKESRWVWYKNSQPIMTVSYEEAYKNGSLEDEVFFHSARYGTSIISRIKLNNIEKVANEINALILENPYIQVSCKHCASKEHYTIDDLVDSEKNPNYNSFYVVCQNCNELVKLQ